MISTNTNINQPIKLYFQATTGITNFSSITVFKDGVLTSSTTSGFIETSSAGLYSFTFTPTSTGRYVIYFLTNIVAYIEVVTKSVYTFLKNIEDECLGSWTWNKQTGKLNMLRQDGTFLADFDVVESLITASRERTL